MIFPQKMKTAVLRRRYVKYRLFRERSTELHNKVELKFIDTTKWVEYAQRLY